MGPQVQLANVTFSSLFPLCVCALKITTGNHSSRGEAESRPSESDEPAPWLEGELFLPLNWAPQALSASHPVPTEHSQTLYVKASHSLPWPSSPTECQIPGGHSPATLWHCASGILGLWLPFPSEFPNHFRALLLSLARPALASPPPLSP